jgi:hypothetical protein
MHGTWHKTHTQEMLTESKTYKSRDEKSCLPFIIRPSSCFKKCTHIIKRIVKCEKEKEVESSSLPPTSNP